MMTDYLLEKSQHNRNLQNGIQPMEYKLNKAKLDELGLSPGKNVNIVPKI